MNHLFNALDAVERGATILAVGMWICAKCRGYRYPQEAYCPCGGRRP